jgi:hypothetical protein
LPRTASRWQRRRVNFRGALTSTCSARAFRCSISVRTGDLSAALLVESNPTPLKYALALFDLMSPRVRLPLVELSEQAKQEIRDVLQRLCDGYAGAMIGNIRRPPARARQSDGALRRTRSHFALIARDVAEGFTVEALRLALAQPAETRSGYRAGRRRYQPRRC